MSKPAYQSHDGFNQRLNTPASQVGSIGKGFKHITQKIPSSQTPTWGGYFVIPIREKGVSLDSVTLEFQTAAALTGLTVTGGSPYLLPAYFWATRIDLYIGSELIDSIPAAANFLTQNIFSQSDAKRSLLNVAAGNFASTASLVTKSASAGYWYLPIPSVWSSASFPLVGNQDLEIRVQMAGLADSFGHTGSAVTGTPAAPFTSCNALCQFTVLPQQVRDYTLTLARKAPLHFAFNEIHQGTFTVSSGVSSANLVLSQIVGYVSTIMFVIRSSSPSGANQMTYNTGLSSFSILSGGSENIVGGQPLTDLQTRLVMYRNWFNNTFSTDTGAGVYAYSFSLDPMETWTRGVNLSGRSFMGNEVLQLTWASSLGSAVQVDVYALSHAALELTPSGCRKITLSE